MELILDTTKRYTYADYMTWLDDKTRELLDGIIYFMSPAPTLKHAKTARIMLVRFSNHIEERGGNCQVFSAPFDVRLPKNGEKDNDPEDVPVKTLPGLVLNTKDIFGY